METNKINYITIQQYLDGTLDKEAMHELERQALNDPFLADALEGYSYTNKPVAPQLSLLQMQLEQRIAQQQENKNVLNFSWQRLSIAAAAGLLFVTATILLWMKTHNAEQQLARQPKTVEVTLTPLDSAESKENEARMQQIDKPLAHAATEDLNEETSVTRPMPKRKQTSNQIAQNTEINSEPAEQSLPKSDLNEVKIVSYGAQRKAAMTGAVSTTSALSLQNQSSLLSGKVVSKSGEPLPGASVRIRGSALGTTTNTEGEFVLRDSVGRVLDVQYLGFQSETVKAKPGNPITVALKENGSALNEVVVVGYGEPTGLPQYSAPANGWKDYRDYIKQNLIMPNPAVKGSVVVAFVINANNEPQNFVIKRGLSESANNEAIRLIKEGPAWLRGQDTTVRVTVRFKK